MGKSGGSLPDCHFLQARGAPSLRFGVIARGTGVVRRPVARARARGIVSVRPGLRLREARDPVRSGSEVDAVLEHR